MKSVSIWTTLLWVWIVNVVSLADIIGASPTAVTLFPNSEFLGDVMTFCIALTSMVILVVLVFVQFAQPRPNRPRSQPRPPDQLDKDLELVENNDFIVPDNERTTFQFTAINDLFWKKPKSHIKERGSDVYTSKQFNSSLSMDISVPKHIEIEAKKRTNLTTSSKRPLSRSSEHKDASHKEQNASAFVPASSNISKVHSNGGRRDPSSTIGSNYDQSCHVNDGKSQDDTTSDRSDHNRQHSTNDHPQTNLDSLNTDETELYRMLQEWRPPKIKLRLSDESRRRISAISIDKRAPSKTV